MADIVIIGGINIDIEGYPYKDLVEQDSNPGRIKISYGGVGRNIAENAARIGEKVAMLSVIGADELGRGARSHLAGLGVDVSMVREIPGRGSAIYLSILNPNRDMHLGLCDMEIIQELTAADIRKAGTVFESAAAVALDGNLEGEMLRDATEILSDKMLFYDPVSANKAHRAKACIGRFHSIKPNLIEAEVLSGMKIETDEELRNAARYFLDKGVKNVYITLNCDGVYFKNKEKEGFIRPPKSIKTESATGAGDAFSAAVLYGMAHGLEIDEIAALGMAASQIAMESEKAVNEKINIEDIKRRVTQNV